MGIRGSHGVRIVRSKTGNLAASADGSGTPGGNFDLDGYADWGSELLANLGYGVMAEKEQKILDLPLPWSVDELLRRGYSQTQLQSLFDFFDNLLVSYNISPNGFDRYIDLGTNNKSQWRLELQQSRKNSRIIVALGRQTVGNLSYIPQGSLVIESNGQLQIYRGTNSTAQQLLMGMQNLLLERI